MIAGAEPSPPERGPSLWAASGIHAARFSRRRVVSWLTLASADQRVVVPGGVATLTAIPGRWRLATWVGAIAAAVAALAVAALRAERNVTVAALTVALMVVLVAGPLALDRRVRTRRAWPDHPGEWVLTDVASGGAGGGDRVMVDVERRADAAVRTVVLAVRADAEPARHLYQRHGFGPLHVTGERLRMLRSPVLSGAAVRSYRPFAMGIGTVLGAVVVALAWPSPVAWLIPPAAVVLTAGAIVDVEQLRVPNALTGLGFVVLSAAVGLLQLETGLGLLGPAVAGAALFTGPLLVMHVATAGRTPGLGDVKLAVSAGLVCGAFDVGLALPALVVSCLAGAVFGTVWQRRTGRRNFPFAPAIGVGTGIVLVAGAWLGEVPT